MGLTTPSWKKFVVQKPYKGGQGQTQRAVELQEEEDTRFIIANHNETEFKFKTNEIFNEINKWFHSYILMLNYDKAYFLQFLTKTNNELNMQVSFGKRKITTVQSLKFLGLTI